MNKIDPDKFRLGSKIEIAPKAEQKPSAYQRQTGRFMRGPIPWNWLATAAWLPGRALHVAIAVWYLRYLHKSTTIKLSAKVLRELGVTRQSGYRSLKALEAAELVSCVRAPGKCPVVTVLEAPVTPNGNGNESEMKGGA